MARRTTAQAGRASFASRAWRATSTSRDSSPARTASRLSARIDTPSYGALSIDATGGSIPDRSSRRSSSAISRSIEHWRVNNGLGVVTSLGLDLTRSQYRFYIPTFPTIGGTTEWLRDGRLQLQASAGEPGNYDGFRLTGFEQLGGSLATTGAQWRFAPQWEAGVQVVDARNVESAYAVNGTNGSTVDAQGGVRCSRLDRGTHAPARQLPRKRCELRRRVRRARTALWLDGRTLWARRHASLRRVPARAGARMGLPADQQRHPGRLLPRRVPEPALAVRRRRRPRVRRCPGAAATARTSRERPVPGDDAHRRRRQRGVPRRQRQRRVAGVGVHATSSGRRVRAASR